MNDLLFVEVKRKLNVTWEDDDTDARIKEIISEGIPTLKHRLGITDEEYDFSTDGPEKTLFKNFCLYEWNHCINEFWDNYAEDIAQLRKIYLVKYNIATDEVNANEE